MCPERSDFPYQKKKPMRDTMQNIRLFAENSLTQAVVVLVVVVNVVVNVVVSRDAGALAM